MSRLLKWFSAAGIPAPRPALGSALVPRYWVFIEQHVTNVYMQIMTLKQWHSNDRKSKINTRTWVKFFLKLAMTFLPSVLLGWVRMHNPRFSHPFRTDDGRPEEACNFGRSGVLLHAPYWALWGGTACMPPTERLTTWHLCFEPRPCTSARLPRRAWYCDTKPCHLYAATARLLAYARTAGSHVSRRCGGAQRLYCKPQMHMDISFAYKGAE